MIGEHYPMRLPAAFATSAAIHAVVLGLILRAALSTGVLFVGPPEPPPEARLIKVSLVSRPGGGGGGPLPGLPSPPRGPAGALPEVAKAAPPPLPQVRLDKPPPPIPRAEASPKPAPAIAAPRLPAPVRFPAPIVAARQPPKDVIPPVAAPAPPVAAPPSSTASAGPAAGSDRSGAIGGDGRGAGRGGGGEGTGDGSGGDGSDGTARPAHGSNPKPPYPLAARRMGVEGVVMLDVLVRPDGSPGDVRVRNSSGSPILDESAVETVRSKWRFVPARRGDSPVESRVTFPIRFRLGAS